MKKDEIKKIVDEISSAVSKLMSYIENDGFIRADEIPSEQRGEYETGPGFVAADELQKKHSYEREQPMSERESLFAEIHDRLINRGRLRQDSFGRLRYFAKTVWEWDFRKNKDVISYADRNKKNCSLEELRRLLEVLS